MKPSRIVYYGTIDATLMSRGLRHDPRHVLAYMLLEHGTLDALSSGQFRQSALAMTGRIDLDPSQAESLAQSYGL